MKRAFPREGPSNQPRPVQDRVATPYTRRGSNCVGKTEMKGDERGKKRLAFDAKRHTFNLWKSLLVPLETGLALFSTSLLPYELNYLFEKKAIF